MKKCLLIIVACLSMLIVSAVPIYATGGKLSVKCTKAENSNITLELYAEHPSAIIAATAVVEYDSNVLKLVRTKNGDIFKTIYVKSQTIDTNPYMLLYVDIEKEEAPTNGLLASYTFDVLDSAKSGKTEIKFYFGQALDINNKELTFSDCTFTLMLKSTEDSLESPDYSSNAIIDENIITVPIPGLNDELETEKNPNNHGNVSSKKDNETYDNGQDIYQSTYTNQNNDKPDNKNEGGDKDKNKNKTIILLIALGGVFAAGTIITLVLIFLKNRPKNKKE